MNTTSQAPFFAPPQDPCAAPHGWGGAIVRRVVKPHGRHVTCESGALWLA